MDDCMENLDSGVLRGILVLTVSPGIIFFVVLSAAVHPFMCSPCMDYYIPFSSWPADWSHQVLNPRKQPLSPGYFWKYCGKDITGLWEPITMLPDRLCPGLLSFLFKPRKVLIYMLPLHLVMYSVVLGLGTRKVWATQKRSLQSWTCFPLRRTVLLFSMSALSFPSARPTSVPLPWQPSWPGSGRIKSCWGCEPLLGLMGDSIKPTLSK